MKSSKKQNSTKNVVNEKSSAGSSSGIKTYFKRTPKPFSVKKNAPETKTNDNKQFYVEILRNKLQGAHNDDDDGKEPGKVGESSVDREYINNVNVRHEDVVSPVESGGHDASKLQCSGCIEKSLEIDDWKKKYELEVAQRKELNQLYVKSTISFTELYSKYNDLLQTTAALPKSDDAAASSSSDDIFTNSELKYLQCMSLDKKHDCSFVLSALKFAYKADLSVFRSRTLFGTAERTDITTNGENIHHSAKDPLTPSKVRRVKTLFIERISKSEINSVDYSQRMKDSYVNTLFAAGIRNLSKKLY